MYSRINYTIVGLFVVFFTIGMLAFGFWLSKNGLEREYSYYNLYFTEPVNGLSVDSPVKLRGVDIGKVDAIKVEKGHTDRVKVSVRLSEEAPIHEGMYATLELQGITGLRYVEIKGGRGDGREIVGTRENPGTIETKASIYNRIVSRAPEMLEKLEKAIEDIDSLFSKENSEKVSTILDNISRASERLDEMESRLYFAIGDINSSVVTAGIEVSKASASLRDTGESITSLVADIDRRVPTILDSIESTTKGIDKLSKNIDKSLSRGDYDIKAIVRPIKADLEELSYRYEELAGDIRHLTDNPSSLIFGGVSPKKGPGE